MLELMVLKIGEKEIKTQVETSAYLGKKAWLFMGGVIGGIISIITLAFKIYEKIKTNVIQGGLIRSSETAIFVLSAAPARFVLWLLALPPIRWLRLVILLRMVLSIGLL